MAADFANLSYCSVNGTSCSWSTQYRDLECYFTNTGGDFRFDKNSNSRHHVSASSGVFCP
jgi:hypothetical protein